MNHSCCITESQKLCMTVLSLGSSITQHIISFFFLFTCCSLLIGLYRFDQSHWHDFYFSFLCLSLQKKKRSVYETCCYMLLWMIRFEEAGLQHTYEGLKHYNNKGGCRNPRPVFNLISAVDPQLSFCHVLSRLSDSFDRDLRRVPLSKWIILATFPSVWKQTSWTPLKKKNCNSLQCCLTLWLKTLFSILVKSSDKHAQLAFLK